ncbi:hypothetical protein ACERK3_06090 [Phycisphaerales bacterium AB-hyl4]|uniref:Uncharacterized protein n=1 Tax=Natronomicrosphaera hydrolytica TaxID=3242702 RepID=A0ABV4U5W4_9BACT
MPPWPTHTLAPTDLVVGPCAWRIGMLADHADYVLAHRSLVVITPDDDDALLAAAAPQLADLPVMLIMPEPSFARRFPGSIESRMQALGRDRLDALMLHVDDVTELKSGGLLQTMFDLRTSNVVTHLGLASDDPRGVEWLAGNTAVRLLGVPYSLTDQAVRHRALPAAAEYGMAAVALTSPADEAGLRFALAERERVLPLLDRPLPETWPAMSEDEVEAAWQRFQADQPPPAALPRGRPPVGDES